VRPFFYSLFRRGDFILKTKKTFFSIFWNFYSFGSDFVGKVYMAALFDEIYAGIFHVFQQNPHCGFL